MKEWNYKFLVLEALAIIFVVLGHNQPINMCLNNIFLFYSFHMALFVFISGYFFKETDIKTFLKKKTYKLILIYMFWNVIYGIIVNVLKMCNIINYGENFSIFNTVVAPFVGNSNQYGFNSSAWFMIALYFVNVIYFILNKILNILKIKERISITIFSIVISIVVLKIFQNNVIPKEYIEYFKIVIRVSFLFPFYCCGILYYKFEKKIKTNIYLSFSINIVIEAILLQKFKRIDYNLNTFFLGKNYLVYFIASLNGISFWIKVANIISEHFKDNKIIEVIGKNTFTIMMHHLFFEFIFNCIIYFLHFKLNILNCFNEELFKNSIWYKYDNGTNGAINLIYVIIGIGGLVLIKTKFYDKIHLKIINKRIKNEKVIN